MDCWTGLDWSYMTQSITVLSVCSIIIAFHNQLEIINELHFHYNMMNLMAPTFN